MDNYSTSDQLGRLWRHKKTGAIYTIVSDCQIEATNVSGTLYRSIEGGPLWCRPSSEFLDGRFEPVEVSLKEGQIDG